MFLNNTFIKNNNITAKNYVIFECITQAKVAKAEEKL